MSSLALRQAGHTIRRGSRIFVRLRGRSPGDGKERAGGGSGRGRREAGSMDIGGFQKRSIPFQRCGSGKRSIHPARSCVRLGFRRNISGQCAAASRRSAADVGGITWAGSKTPPYRMTSVHAALGRQLPMPRSDPLFPDHDTLSCAACAS